MGCITAPALEDLHLDGLREREDEDEREDWYEWAGWEKKSVYDAWHRDARMCGGLRSRPHVWHELRGSG